MTPYFRMTMGALALAASMMVSCKAFAITPNDLLLGEVLDAGRCQVGDVVIPCMKIQLGNKTFVIFLDGRFVPLVIFDVTGKEDSDISDLQPAWTRNSKEV